MMDPVVATLIVLAIISLGEIMSIWTRAKVPTLLVVTIVIFALFETGIVPKNIIEASTFAVVGAVLQPALLVHMGTMIPMKVMKSQYKAVLITLIGLVFSILFILLIIPLIFNYSTAVAGAGPLTGGLIAYLVTAEALQKAGLASLIAIPIIVLTLQGLVGMPLTSLLLRRHGLKIRRSMDAGTYTAATVALDEVGEKDIPDEETKKRTLIPEKYLQSSFILLFMIFIGGAIAIGLENLTGISYSLFGLAIGIFGAYIGFYPARVLEKANGFSIAMVGLVFIVLASLASTTLENILSVLPAVATIIVIGTIGLIIGGYIGSKIFKWDPNKGISVVLTAMYGFPGDYLISQEVSRSIGRTKEEEEAILNEILPPMLIGGFTSVSVGSVVIASILVQTL
jgi:MFS family permease